MKLDSDAELKPGDYEGALMISSIDPASGEETMVNTNAHVYVKVVA